MSLVSGRKLGTSNYDLGLGLVGIGTKTPEVPLHVKADYTSPAIFESSSTGKGVFIDIKRSSGDRALLGLGGNGYTGGDTSNVVLANWNSTRGGISFYTRQRRRMSLDSAGNLGIGNNSPSELLTVGSSSNAGNIKVYGNIEADGDFTLGSGMSSVDFTLHGTAAIEDSLTIGSSGAETELKLYGVAKVKNIRVDPTMVWADHVFSDDYSLKSLEEVKSFVSAEKHLPDMPTADEVAKDGYDMTSINAKFLEKIEELTLYVIDLNDKVKALESENKKLRKRRK